MTTTDPAAVMEAGEPMIDAAATEKLRPGSIPRPWNPRAADRYILGDLGEWHAVPDAAALIGTDPISMTGQAACGALVWITTRFGRYERRSWPLSSNPCLECAWQVAVETGSTGGELALYTPGARDAAAIARTGANPMLAINVTAAILARSVSPDADYEPDHPATIQLLAHAIRHRPKLLVSEDCSEDPYACQHRPDDAGDDWHCSYPGAAVACGTCSLQAGAWAGEWEGDYRDECTVTYPCSTLTTLAARYLPAPAAPGQPPR